MRILSKLKLLQQFSLVIVFVALMGAINLSFCFYLFNDSLARVSYLQEKLYPTLKLAKRNIVLLENVDEALTQVVVIGDQEQKDEALDSLIEIKQNLEQISAIDPTLKSSETLKTLKSHLDIYAETGEKLVKIMLNPDANISLDEVQNLGLVKSEHFEILTSEFKQFMTSVDAKLADTVVSMESFFHVSRQVLIGICLFNILLTAILLVSIAKRITATSSQFNESLSALAEGDLTQSLKIKGKDELASMASFFNQSICNLSRAIFKVRDHVEPMFQWAEKISENSKAAKQQVFSQTQQAAEAQSSML